jgi:ribosome-associated toxin RatA of RatAB toxin-antitoxin module
VELRRSVLLPYSVDSMFDLIERAEHYPEFLPWCTRATIFERSDDWVAARLDFSYLGFSFGFETRNAKRRPEWLQVRLVKGPFRRFHADWRLVPLGQIGCKIDFDVSYEIADGLLDRLARPAVELVSRSMMDAFVKRADSVLVESAPHAVARPASAAPPSAAPEPLAHVSETP